MTLKKTNSGWGVIALATLTMAAVMVSPQAAAKHNSKKSHRSVSSSHVSKKRYKKGRHTVTESYETRRSFSHSSVNSGRVDALESQLRSMQAELDALRAQQAGAGQPDPQTTARVQELEQWMADTKSKPARDKKNMVFFRGGWADQDHTRSGVSIPQIAADAGIGTRGDDEGFYIGAGMDFSLDDNMFGLIPNTELLAEVMFEWKDYGRSRGVGISTDGTTTANGYNATLVGRNVSVSEFVISASPKIKFLKDSAFRPWIIPVGFAAHIISPPSESITVFNPGMMFGAGADFNIYKSLYAGIDARYHLTSRSGDGVNTDGYTAGGYIGFGF